MDGIGASITGASSSSSFRYIKAIPTSTSFTMQWEVDDVLVDYDITTIGSGAFEVFRTVSTPSGGTAISFSNKGDNILIENCDFSYIGPVCNAAWKTVCTKSLLLALLSSEG
jgi:hypothetical protein